MTIMTSVAKDGNDAQEHFGGKNHRGCTACGVFRAQVHRHSTVHRCFSEAGRVGTAVCSVGIISSSPDFLEVEAVVEVVQSWAAEGRRGEGGSAG